MTTSVTTSAAGQAVCLVCGLGFTRVRRQAYCSPGCRQSAWRTRQTHQATTTASAVTVPARRFRRDVTVYTCTECEQRYLGQQWCPEWRGTGSPDRAPTEILGGNQEEIRWLEHGRSSHPNTGMRR